MKKLISLFAFGCCLCCITPLFAQPYYTITFTDLVLEEGSCFINGDGGANAEEPQFGLYCAEGGTLIQAFGWRINLTAAGTYPLPTPITTCQSSNSWTFDAEGRTTLRFWMESAQNNNTGVCAEPAAAGDGCIRRDYVTIDLTQTTGVINAGPGEKFHYTLSTATAGDPIPLFDDIDGDGLIDCQDPCPVGPNPGESCDDGDPNTTNDRIEPDCVCRGATGKYKITFTQLEVLTGCINNESGADEAAIMIYCESDLETQHLVKSWSIATAAGNTYDLPAPNNGACATDNSWYFDAEGQTSLDVWIQSFESDNGVCGRTMVNADQCKDEFAYTFDLMATEGTIENSNGFIFHYIIEYADSAPPLASCTPENTAARCADGIDNDGDGLVDCDDPGCEALAAGCSTCFGDGLSFADEVLTYEPTCNNINTNNTDPDKAIGAPDNRSISLGQGGVIRLAFTNNLLTNSGDGEPDLWVFEIGPQIEGSDIELRPLDSGTATILQNEGILDTDGDGYYEIDRIGGSTASLDIDEIVPGYNPGILRFDAIKITDVPGTCQGSTPGADIDAVCALSSVPCEDADGDLFNSCQECDDNDPDVFPGAVEICDGKDNDCDGLIDGDDPDLVDGQTWYLDVDQDGVGDASSSIIACEQPDGYAESAGDECPTDPNKVLAGDCGCGVSDADSDGDGTADCADECPNDPDKVLAGDCGCGVSDADSDGDGTVDCVDECPTDPDKVLAGDCGCGVSDADSDGDGTADCVDECPNDPDKVLAGDCGCGVSDADSDGDGTADCVDECPNDPDKVLAGDCGCGVSDADSDGDGTADCADECPTDPDKVLAGDCGCGVSDTDSDGDGTADCVDECPNDPDKVLAGDCGCGVSDADSDGDGTADCADECPTDPEKVLAGDCGCGVSDADSDGDGTADCVDECPNDPDKVLAGDCGCGVSDVDSDGDGTADCVDECPNDPDKVLAGDCGCGVSDVDSDGDGTADCVDECPNDPDKVLAGDCGCGVSDADSDGDGTADCADECPTDPDKVLAGDCGCGVSDADSDGDGTADCVDECPTDPDKVLAGDCGCGVSDTDSDGDGTADCVDECPTDPDKVLAGDCGCGVSDADSDGDGTADCADECPTDPDKVLAGDCGCGVSDTDSDGDGTADCVDECPNDPDKVLAGDCGCGVSDADSDGDGTADCADECPTDPDKVLAGDCGCGNDEPGASCDDGDANTANDVIGEDCICRGELIDSCADGIQNNGEIGIDCGGDCDACQEPVAICGFKEIFLDPNAPDFDGPGGDDIWLIPVTELDFGSLSSSEDPLVSVRRWRSYIDFDWTKRGACIDFEPNTRVTSADRGLVWRECLPIKRSDFGNVLDYRYRVADEFGTDQCRGEILISSTSPENSTAGLRIDRSSLREQDIATMQLYPNPGAERMQLLLSGVEIDQQIMVQILDINGREIQRQTLRAEHRLEFDMRSQLAGVYWVKVHWNGGVMQRKWVKVTP